MFVSGRVHHRWPSLNITGLRCIGLDVPEVGIIEDRLITKCHQMWRSSCENVARSGWTNPFEKYDRQIGSFPQVGVKIKNSWSHHLVQPPFFLGGKSLEAISSRNLTAGWLEIRPICEWTSMLTFVSWICLLNGWKDPSPKRNLHDFKKQMVWSEDSLLTNPTMTVAVLGGVGVFPPAICESKIILGHVQETIWWISHSIHGTTRSRPGENCHRQTAHASSGQNRPGCNTSAVVPTSQRLRTDDGKAP